jgi:hypothetical protein
VKDSFVSCFDSSLWTDAIYTHRRRFFLTKPERYVRTLSTVRVHGALASVVAFGQDSTCMHAYILHLFGFDCFCRIFRVRFGWLSRNTLCGYNLFLRCSFPRYLRRIGGNVGNVDGWMDGTFYIRIPWTGMIGKDYSGKE